MTTNSRWMQLALQQAQQADYTTWQNPRVGAVIVKDQRVLAAGHTQAYGGWHAERVALAQVAPDQLRGATLYVTMEPCNHYGKQPPCTDLIIQAGVTKVVIAQRDPHQLVAGKGIRYLQAHGLAVEVGVLATVAEHVNPHYNHYYRQHRPWITLKQAMSLDGKVAAAPGVRTPITNSAAKQRVHVERAWFHGIVIGSQTALVDDPQLTTTAPTANPPVRIVIDRRGRLADRPQLQLLTDGAAPTWIFTCAPQLKVQLAASKATVYYRPQWPLSAVVTECGRQGLQALYVEGGPRLHQAFWDQGLVDEVITYLSPRMLGQTGVAGFQAHTPWQPGTVAYEVFGDNIRITERMSKNV